MNKRLRLAQFGLIPMGFSMALTTYVVGAPAWLYGLVSLIFVAALALAAPELVEMWRREK